MRGGWSLLEMITFRSGAKNTEVLAVRERGRVDCTPPCAAAALPKIKVRGFFCNGPRPDLMTKIPLSSVSV